MKLLKLTDADGNPVWINPTWVTKVTVPLPDTVSKKANTVVTLSGSFQAVTESQEEVVRLLEKMEVNKK